MPRKPHTKRWTQSMIQSWSQTEQHHRTMAAQYQDAAAMLRDQGREDDAAFLETMADGFLTSAATARTIMADLQAKGA